MPVDTDLRDPDPDGPRLVYLVVAPGSEQRAQAAGALLDPGSRRWCALRPLPPALLPFLPAHQPATRRGPPPVCPACGGGMRRVPGRGGVPYLRCVTQLLAGCRGDHAYPAFLEGAQMANRLGGLLPAAGDDVRRGLEAGEREDGPHPLRPLWEEVARVAIETLGGVGPAMNWLRTPKQVFLGLQPIQMLGTEGGCRAVLMVISTIWD